MNRDLHRAARRWLREERGGGEGRADRALREVFVHLPLPRLPAGFSERVLEACGLGVAPAATGRRVTVWSLRALLSLCLALGALSVWLLPTLFPSLLGLAHPGRLLELGLDLLVSLCQRLGVGLVVWRVLSEIGGLLASALASPRYLLVLMTSALLSFGALRILHGLILSERSSHHVRSA